MAILTEAGFISKWVSRFADNSTREISESDIREFAEDIKDSFFCIEDDAYASFAVVASGSNAYTITTNPAFTSLVNYSKLFVKFPTGSTGAVTLNPNGIGAKKVYISPTSQAGNTDITANRIYLLMYDSALDSASGGYLIIGGGASGDVDGGSL